MRYNYAKPDVSSVDMELESAILEGSYTNKAMKVNQVTVEDYANGFSATEFPNGFQDITFE